MLLRTTVSVAAAFLGLGILAGPAAAADNPANLGNVENSTRSTPHQGPHCHFNLRAGAASGKTIITAAAHEGHFQTGTPTGIFEATPCP